MRKRMLFAAVLLSVLGIFAGLAEADFGAAGMEKDAVLQWIKSDDADMIDSALKRGLDVDARLDDSGMTLLHIAIILGSDGVARKLIEEGADIEAESGGERPLYSALAFSVGDLDASRRASKRQIIELLFEKGADVGALNEWGDSPLNIASRGRNVEFCLGLAQQLVARGAKANTKNDFGLTPLHDAFTVFVADELPGGQPPHPDMLASRAPLVAFLIASGADVNARNMDGDTPLFYALTDIESMRLLLGAGARFDIKNNKDETPMDIALEEKYDDAVKELLLRIGS